jgi:hypothetical protein
MAATFNYNVTPPPTSGTDAFGKVPGSISLPQPMEDLGNVYPNLSGTNAAASAALTSRLQGQLSPDTLKQIQDASATFGVTSGMPGSGLAQNRSLRDVGLMSEQVQGQGLQEYGPVLGAASRTQTVSPETEIGVAEQNALNLAAPNPAAASSYATGLFEHYLSSLRGGGAPGRRGGSVPATLAPSGGFRAGGNLATGGELDWQYPSGVWPAPIAAHGSLPPPYHDPGDIFGAGWGNQQAPQKPTGVGGRTGTDIFGGPLFGDPAGGGMSAEEEFYNASNVQ